MSTNMNILSYKFYRQSNTTIILQNSSLPTSMLVVHKKYKLVFRCCTVFYGFINNHHLLY